MHPTISATFSQQATTLCCFAQFYQLLWSDIGVEKGFPPKFV
jgi:hypothetical protein